MAEGDCRSRCESTAVPGCRIAVRATNYGRNMEVFGRKRAIARCAPEADARRRVALRRIAVLSYASTEMRRGCTAGVFGIVTSRTPLVCLALICSVLAPSGSVKRRRKVPATRSMRS